ncbi:MAG: hypothetical protein K0R08_2029 [Solimicrobium sp.]|jgi:hypothetical protein|nr:hypothetical protein [Solimicrobium sp.]
MKLFFVSIFMIFYVGLTGLTQANSDIYVCVNNKGVKTFSNVGSNKGCKKINLPGLATFSAPRTRSAGMTPIPPSNFPTVDSVTQKNRDLERRKILETELNAEQKKLTDLNAVFKNGEPDRLGDERNYAKYQERTEGLRQEINRTQNNIDALQREIGGLN